METATGDRWFARIEISTNHAGLQPIFRSLEVELYRCLSLLNEPRDCGRYLEQVTRELRRNRETVLVKLIEVGNPNRLKRVRRTPRTSA